MVIYSQEIKDGLSAAINSSASISIAALAEPVAHDNTKNIHKNLKALASYNDSDLYYVQSILVTSSWNKNDDIFTKEEVWAAKNTPEDKPTNLEHDENTIIGHIVSNWSITDDGILIDENTPIENLPNKFHIVTGSVIYKAYTNPELKDRTSKLIAEIENGSKYVSMECIFKGFDYGLINDSTGEYKILERSEATAFLTKHLRAYGGTGKYDNHRIGRVLRNITFSGKGYVDKPANPDSIIFSKDNFLNNTIAKNTENDNSGVSEIRPNNTETNNMSLEKEVADLKEQIAALESTIAAKDQELADSKAAHSDLLSTIEAAEAAKKSKEDEMEKKEEEMAKTKSELVAALETIAGYKNKEKKMKRVAFLLEKGLDQEVASSAVDQFDSLEDAAFEAMVELISNAAKKGMKPSEDKKEEKKVMSSEELSEAVLDTAEPNQEIDLSAGSDVAEEVQTTRAALVDFVCARLGKKLNKGE